MSEILKEFTTIVRQKLVDGVRFARTNWLAVLLAVPLSIFAGFSAFDARIPWYSQIVVVAMVAVGSFMAVSFLLVIATVAFIALRAFWEWLRRDPVRHIRTILIGFILLAAWGWIASSLGFGKGHYCEPDGRGGEVCYND